MCRLLFEILWTFATCDKRSYHTDIKVVIRCRQVSNLYVTPRRHDDQAVAGLQRTRYDGLLVEAELGVAEGLLERSIDASFVH